MISGIDNKQSTPFLGKIDQSNNQSNFQAKENIQTSLNFTNLNNQPSKNLFGASDIKQTTDNKQNASAGLFSTNIQSNITSTVPDNSKSQNLFGNVSNYPQPSKLFSTGTENKPSGLFGTNEQIKEPLDKVNLPSTTEANPKNLFGGIFNKFLFY